MFLTALKINDQYVVFILKCKNYEKTLNLTILSFWHKTEKFFVAQNNKIQAAQQKPPVSDAFCKPNPKIEKIGRSS